MNFLWLDVETTGRDPNRTDIVQIGAIMVINGEIKGTFNEHCQPINWNTIEQEALNVNKLTMEQLKTFQSPRIMIEKFTSWCAQYKGRSTIAGFNVDFDRKFISSFFTKLGKDKEFFNIFNADTHDTFKRAKAIKSQLNTENLKLETLCKHFGVAIDAHDALSDIQATMEVDKFISKIVGDEDKFFADIEYKTFDRPFKPLVQLHCHSVYSYTDSVTDISEWMKWCDSTKTPGISFADHWSGASLYNIVRLKDLIKDMNKKEGTNVDPNSITGIPGLGIMVDVDGTIGSLNAWATSNEGYYNLIKLASIGWENTIPDSGEIIPIVKFDEVVANKAGLVFGTSGVNGVFSKLLLEGKHQEFEARLLKLKNNLDLRVELVAVDVYKYFDSSFGFRNYKIDGDNMQKSLNQMMFRLAEKHGIKCIPVSESHFIDPEDKIIQDCVSKNAFKDNRYFFESRHQRSTEEIYSILNVHLGLSFDIFDSMIANTYDIMDAAKTIEIKQSYHLPKIEIPENLKKMTDDENLQTYYLTMQKVKEHGRWNDNPVYVARFKQEIDVVMKNEKLNFLPYFLVYEDICTYARSQGFLQNIARGSAGGSLLSYYLKVIHVDPIAEKLPFERFLSHARIRAGSFPDIDLDLAKNARPFIMEYLKKKYNMGFAQIATFSKMKTKNAIKDAMWALYGKNRNDPEVVALCETIADSPQGVDEHDFLYGYVDQEGEEHKGEVQTNEMLRNFFEGKPEIEKMVQRLIGTIRGWSRHASAFVISTLNLSETRIPTMKMQDNHIGDIYVTQFDAPMVEKSGLVKADILGINTLNMVGDCVKMVIERGGVNYLENNDKGVQFLYRLPEEPGVYADFYNKQTDSSFQFNTGLIKGFVQEFAPVRREDLSTFTALARPGALDAPLEDTTAAQYYLDVKNGRREAKFLHEDLRPILEESHGVFVYQEQIMKFLVEIVGYTWEESDIIRSAIAKKKHEVIMATFDKIRASCKSRGWTEEAVDTVCKQVQAFSRYSFNRSHSRAYGELGYITMYLKHFHPLEWWCSVMNNEEDEDKMRAFSSKLSQDIKPPSLRNPSKRYVILDGKIATPLSALKGLGPSVVNELVSKGPFKSLQDYISRVDHSKVNIGGFSTLIKARATDDLMDQSIATYTDRRLKFMKEYITIRRVKNKAVSDFKQEMYDADPIQIFMDERTVNQSFTKSLLEEREVADLLKDYNNIQSTNNPAIPFTLGSTYIIKDIATAAAMLKKKPELMENKEFLMIMLMQSSETKQGISKKNNRPWKNISSIMSDGYMTIEGVDWNSPKPYRLPENSLVFVRGIIKQGWKGQPQISIVENGIEPVKLKTGE